MDSTRSLRCASAVVPATKMLPTDPYEVGPPCIGLSSMSHRCLFGSRSEEFGHLKLVTFLKPFLNHCCGLLSSCSVLQVTNAYAPSHDAKESMIHPSFMAPWSSSDAHIFGASSNGSVRAPWLVCNYAAPYATNYDALYSDSFLSEPTLTIFSNLSYSRSDNMGQPSVPLASVSLACPLPCCWFTTFLP